MRLVTIYPTREGYKIKFPYVDREGYECERYKNFTDVQECLKAIDYIESLYDKPDELRYYAENVLRGKREQEEGDVPRTALFREACDMWINAMLANTVDPLRPSTLSSYRRYVEKHIVPALGNITVENLSADVVKQYVDDLHQDAAISASVAQKVIATLNLALKYCNLPPCRPAAKPKGGQRRKSTFFHNTSFTA